MPYLTEANVRSFVTGTVNDRALISELSLIVEKATAALTDRFDIFLSHAVRDAELVLGVKRILERAGKSVYVDWISDRSLDRNAITAETAETLRLRMKKCDSLIYLYSRHSQTSRWMPWELGYFDGFNGNVAILPLLPNAGQLDFDGEEYLQVYPKVDVIRLDQTPSLFVNKSRKLEAGAYKRFDDWTAGQDKLRPT